MNNSFNERSYGVGKRTLNHHSTIPGGSQSYGSHMSSPPYPQTSLPASAGRSHSCSSPGSSASSICSTGTGGVSMSGAGDSCGVYNEGEFPQNQPPPLIGPRSSNHRHSGQTHPYSPGSPSSNTWMPSPPLPFNAASVNPSSPSGSMSSSFSTDVLTSHSSPSASSLDPSHRLVLDFVNRRWKEAQAKQNRLVQASANSCFDETSQLPPQQTPTPTTKSASRCSAPTTMPVP